MARFVFKGAAVAMTAMLVGCMPKMTIEEMKAMMPSRPAELDQLNTFVGSWESTGTGTFAGLDEPLKARSESEIKWSGDGWYMIEDARMYMEGFDPMSAHGVWTYDQRSDKFRVTWVDSMGGIASGTSTYDDASNTWRMRCKSRSPFGTTTGVGTMHFIDKDTCEWSWSESAFFGLIKVCDMQGTMTRK